MTTGLLFGRFFNQRGNRRQLSAGETLPVGANESLASRTFWRWGEVAGATRCPLTLADLGLLQVQTGLRALGGVRYLPAVPSSLRHRLRSAGNSARREIGLP